MKPEKIKETLRAAAAAFRARRPALNGLRTAAAALARLYAAFRARRPALNGLRTAAAALALLSAALTLLTLTEGARTYAPAVPAGDKLLACLGNPALTVFNLLPPLLLMLLGWLLTRRVWAGYLVAALPTAALAAADTIKVALRGDPLLFSDLRLIRTAGGIIGRYQLPDSTALPRLLFWTLALLALSLLPPPTRLTGRTRPVGLMACVTAAALLLTPCFISEESYRLTENDAFVSEYSDNELYASRGLWYSFLHSAPDVFSPRPDDYATVNALRILSNYQDADIPEEQKVQVVGVMLEAFCDLTDYPVLAANKSVAAIYEPLHELEERCVSGDLITNIFAGGTVETEWNFLTGYCYHGEFTEPVDSYVRYFDDQGYETVFQHPGYSWFYDRRAVNAYLGFDRSVFTEDGFGELVDPKLAPYRSDAVLYDYLLDSLDRRTASDAPLFSFSVTYQNHGPYGTADFDGAAVTPRETGWSKETCGILSHYLYGIDDSIQELRRFVDELDRRKTPVVAVFFGDHKPWLGNEKSVYDELGVNMDMSTEEGFRNVHSTPYLIYANRAAKRVLGRGFTGDGGDISPCLLMEELFDSCGWEGPRFLQLQRDVRERVSPLLHVRGMFLVDGEFLPKDELPRPLLNFYLTYRDAEVWREHYGLSDEAS